MSALRSRSVALPRCGAALALIAAPLLTARPAEPLRDPMRPPSPAHSAAAAQPQGPVLTAVMSFEGRRTAIFNGHLVRAGSVIGAYTIDAVLEDGVRYREARLTRELHLAPVRSPIKKPAAEPARAP